MVYGIAWRASHGVWYGLAGLAWLIVWPGGRCMVLWYVLVGLAWDMAFLAAIALYSMVLRTSHGIWYGMAGIALYMVMAWQTRRWACHSVWYGLVGMAWYIVWPGGQGMVYDMACGYGMIYGMAWRASHGVWYGLADIAWYMVWHCEVWHGMWQGLVVHALRHYHGL